MKRFRLQVVFSAILSTLLVTSCGGTATMSPEAAGQDNGSGQPHFNAGFEAIRNQDWETAKSEFTLGLEQIPDRSEALTARGRAKLVVRQN